jgi:hypothetical protein
MELPAAFTPANLAILVDDFESRAFSFQDHDNPHKDVIGVGSEGVVFGLAYSPFMGLPKRVALKVKYYGGAASKAASNREFSAYRTARAAGCNGLVEVEMVFNVIIDDADKRGFTVIMMELCQESLCECLWRLCGWCKIGWMLQRCHEPFLRPAFL